MKRNTILIVIFLLLSSVAGYYFWANREGTYSEELSNFAVEDTAAITKIFLADKSGHQVTLTREENGEWMVNKKFIARHDAIRTLLYTIKNVDVRSPIGKASYKNVVELMSARAVKCEIYAGEKKLITYYVGHATQDQLGTFMYIEGSSVPFVTHIPGFNGYLTTRYFTYEMEWRERYVFHYRPGEIAKIEVAANDEKDGNYNLIYNKGKAQYELFAPGSAVALAANIDRVNMYVSFFNDVKFEGYTDIMRREMFDSLLTVGWFRKISVTDARGNLNQVAFYRKPVSRRSLSALEGRENESPYDLDRMFARLNDDTIMVTTQYQLFDKLFKNVSDFSK